MTERTRIAHVVWKCQGVLRVDFTRMRTSSAAMPEMPENYRLCPNKPDQLLVHDALEEAAMNRGCTECSCRAERKCEHNDGVGIGRGVLESRCRAGGLTG